MPLFETPWEDLIQPTGHRLWRFYTFRQGLSVIKVSGHYVNRLVLAEDDLISLVQGVDWFLGGHIYDISEAVAADLVADGYTVRYRYGDGPYGSGPYGLSDYGSGG